MSATGCSSMITRQALSLILERGRVGETYNIGGDSRAPKYRCGQRNLRHAGQACAEPTRKPHRELITFVSDRPGHDFRYAIDCTKLKTELGWPPRHTFESGLRATVQWYIDNRAWWEPLLAKHRCRQPPWPVCEECMTNARSSPWRNWSGRDGDLRDLRVEAGVDLVAPGQAELDLTDGKAIAGLIASSHGTRHQCGCLYEVDGAENKEAMAFAINAEAPARIAAGNRRGTVSR